MSRKTRKLMWSVPLIAAVAVIGALAAYVMLAPGGAFAHSGDSVSVSHQPPGPVTGIDVTTPSVADGGRTSLAVSWNAPTGMGADMPTMYRVDISKDTLVWMNVIGGEASDDTLTESMAMSNCGDDDEGDRCYMATGLDSDTLYHFRVFAMNDHGTSGISVDETIASGETLRIDPPARVMGITATDYYTDKIVVSWNEVEETGGADLLWYCLAIAASPSGDFLDLAGDEAAETGACRDAVEATAAAVADDDGVYTTPVVIDTLVNDETDVPVAIVVAATDEDGNAVTSYEHLGLGGEADDDNAATFELPDSFELRYRLYAVTSESGKMGTTDDRRISRAASQTATGKTIEPPNKPDSRAAAPGAVGNLRAVAYSSATPLAVDGTTGDATTGQNLHFYWTHPEGFDPNVNDDTTFDDPNWRVEVQRRVAVEDGQEYPGWQFVTGTAAPATPIAGYSQAQFTVDFAASDAPTADPPTYDAPDLWGASVSDRRYRVRYVNQAETPGNTAATTDDDVNGAWANITIPVVDTNYYLATTLAESTLPIITKAADNGTHTDREADEGLRFLHNEDDPRDHIDLLWMQDTNANTEQDKPNGYVIDRSSDGGNTWQVLSRADRPNDLGRADTFTDSPSGDHKLVPGAKYRYRVFPVFIQNGPDAYGVPAFIDASSRGADHPSHVRSLRVEADGQHAFDLSWRAPADDGGHEIRGYLIQVTDDDDGDPDDAGWEDIAPSAASGLTAPLTVGKGALMYKYRPTTTTGSPPDEVTTLDLNPGTTKWFRVIAITNENDGDDDTGGSVVQLTDGVDAPTRSPDETGETAPLDHDAQEALPEDGTTDRLDDAPADKDPAPPQRPVDLTAEAASDTNALGDSARGVFLTWNMQEKGTASETTGYRIERKRMNTGVEALNDDDYVFLKTVEDVTSYTDDDELRRDEETRMYRVGSVATGIDDPTWVAMSVGYGLHMAHMPDAPTGVMAESSADGTMLTVTWTASGSDGGSAITKYMVMYRMTGSDGDYMSMDAAADATMATISGLMAGTSYDIAVVAVNAIDESAMAMVMGMTHSVPDMPTSVMAMSSADGTMLTVSWMAPADNGGSAITGYKVMYKMTGSDGDYMSMDAAAADTMATIGSLSPNTGYDIAVVAVNAVGYSDKGMPMAMAMTSDIAPNMPAGVSAMADDMYGRTQINVSWMAPAANGGSAVTGYMVMYKMTGSDGDYMSMPAMADATSAAVSGLTPGTSYTFKVRADNAAGMGAYAEAVMATTTANMAPAGTASTAMVTAGETVMVESNIADPEGDMLTWSVMSDMEMYATAMVDDMGMVTITGVAAGMATITVTATDSFGAEGTQAITVTVASANTAPMAEPDLTASVKAGETVMVQSTITDSDEGDTLTWSVMSDMEMYATAEVNDTGMVTITGVAVGMATITVTATDMAGESAMQDITVTVTQGTLMDPSNVMASHDGTEVTVTWEGGDHADTFTVVLLRMNDDGTPDVFNTIFDRDVTSPHPVTMGNNLPGRYLVGVAAGQDSEDGSRTWTDWARSELNYQP